MSLIVDMITFVIDMIFDTAASKVHKRNAALAWGLIFLGFLVVVTTILLFYRYVV